MRMIRLTLAAAALAFLSAPAHAADPAQIDCPLASLTAEQRGALDAFVAEQGARQDPRFQVYQRAVEQCAARFHWSTGAQANASNFGITMAAEAHMRRLLTARGIDLRPIESALLADRAAMDAASGSPAQQQALLAFLQRNSGMVAGLVGARAADDQLMAWLGVFIAARAVREGARAAFLAD